MAFPQVGEVHQSAVILAAHQHGAEKDKPVGIVLGYLEHKREYVVWSVGPEGDFSNGAYRFDINDALNIYSERVMQKLYSHYNRIAPTYTYNYKNEQ